MPSNFHSRVLVVDDERVIADTLCAILRYRDYDAQPVYSAEEAILWCEQRCPDIVISDVNLGRMNGIELAMHLAKTQPTCKVLLISGNAATLSLMGNEAGFKCRFPILSKPIQPGVLLDFLSAF